MDHPNSKAEEGEKKEARYNEFVALLARHDPSIRRFVRSLMPTNDGVDDVLQDTALECWKKFDDFQPATVEDAAGEFIRWACVIARYKAMSWQRDKSRDRLVFKDSVMELLAQTAMSHLDTHDSEREAVESCLEKMQADQRQLVLSVHSPGQSVAKIASETGEKSRRLYTRVNQLRKSLLACVQQQLAGEIGHG